MIYPVEELFDVEVYSVGVSLGEVLLSLLHCLMRLSVMAENHSSGAKSLYPTSSVIPA